MKILSDSNKKLKKKGYQKKFREKIKEKFLEQKCNNQAIKKLKKEYTDESEVEDVLMKFYDACVDSAIHSDEDSK